MQTFDSQRLRHQRQMDARLIADHRQLARLIAGMVVRAATARDASGQPVIPQSRSQRDALKTAIWEQVLKPYYVGNGTDPLRGPTPQSPYAALLVEGIERATRIQAERQAAIVRRLCKDPVVLAWLTGPRNVLAVREMASISGRITELNTLRIGDDPIVTRTVNAMGFPADLSRLVSPKGMYEPFHQFVDPNGYRLSDRIWRTSIDVRSRVDRLLEYHISAGTSAVEIADLLEPFLTPGGKVSRTLKPYPPPYGSEGSYAARRLARTEITAAAGRATVNAAAANPFVERLQWRTSGSHPKPDVCDANAHGGPNGDGIYAIGATPPYPSHPMCMCHLLPVPTGTTADLVSSMRADIQAARGNLIDAASGGNATRARQLQGILNPDYLTRAIMSGNLEEAVQAAASTGGRLPQNVRARVVRAVTPKVVAKPRIDLPYRPAQAQLDEVANSVDFNVLKPNARRVGLSQDEYERALIERMNQHVDGKVPRIRAGESSAQYILDEGRFMTQFETGGSGGTYKPEYRKANELKGLGVPADLAPNLRPVYGYYDTPQHAAGRYGSIEFVLKPSVVPRTTVTLGDSLGPMSRDAMIGTPANAITKHALGDGFSARKLYEGNMAETYIEAQIHGGVRITDIDEVILHRNEFNTRDLLDVENAAARAGIKVSYAN